MLFTLHHRICEEHDSSTLLKVMRPVVVAAVEAVVVQSDVVEVETTESCGWELADIDVDAEMPAVVLLANQC